jgi:formylglycine-generating enzyme required for sulfatase activity
MIRSHFAADALTRTAFLIIAIAFVGCSPQTPKPSEEQPSPALTMTATPIDDSTPTPAPTGFAPVAANADWTPVERDFNTVTMMLVPAGCFMMGSTDINSNEMPEHQQCFDAPFWIDRMEVTNAQFDYFEGKAEEASNWDGSEYPREHITGLEAVAFCEQRDARLITEREWEYAARGPDNLKYPWGDEWDGTKLAWEDNSRDRTGGVGRYPDGASWIGALDMSGSVWEWTTSIDKPYPYNPADGRENRLNIRSFRIVRGGSWANQPEMLTTSYRLHTDPTLNVSYIGFRCARDYSS